MTRDEQCAACINERGTDCRVKAPIHLQVEELCPWANRLFPRIDPNTFTYERKKKT